MKIRATFINRTWDPSVIELIHAWDEFQIDENSDGYRESLDKELATYEPEVEKVVTIDIKIPYSELERLFLETPVIEGAVEKADG